MRKSKDIPEAGRKYFLLGKSSLTEIERNYLVLLSLYGKTFIKAMLVGALLKSKYEDLAACFVADLVEYSNRFASNLGEDLSDGEYLKKMREYIMATARDNAKTFYELWVVNKKVNEKLLTLTTLLED